MKKIISIILILSSVLQLSAQELEFFTTYSGSDYNKFQSNYGYGFGYNHYIKSNNKFGFTFQHSFCNSNYSEIYSSLIDGISTYIKKVEPENQRIVIKMNYAFKIVNYPKSSLYIGPEIGINYFLIKEQIHRLENENLNAGDYQSQYSRNNKIGMGFLIEFELKEIISKRISISLSTHPEITSFDKCGLDGVYSKCLIGWLNFNFGIKYNLKNK
ncbi:MAG: hypothetical protein K8R41_03295 [Bacteroidales bacterium]|nr:hypothetical protein [Bacteroidales bacterium]